MAYWYRNHALLMQFRSFFIHNTVKLRIQDDSIGLPIHFSALQDVV